MIKEFLKSFLFYTIMFFLLFFIPPKQVKPLNTSIWIICFLLNGIVSYQRAKNKKP